MNLRDQYRTRSAISARILLVSTAALGLTACDTFSKRESAEAVARDWATTIRASQVIPIYPLSEDMQPGDIFLVQLPVDRQQEAYKKDGYLPLDNLIGRVQPNGYSVFYGSSFFSKDEPPPILPRDWLNTKDDAAAWKEAPNVKFPSYSFSVRRGGGFNLAVPVQGVPLGLSLMGGDAAQGTIVIADAKTYGVDTISLLPSVEGWAATNRNFLANFAPDGKRQNYVRVVSRVFLTKRVNVSLQSSRAASGGVSAGAPKPVDLVVPGTNTDTAKQTMDSYQDNLNKLNKTLEDALKTLDAKGNLLPGGTIKVAAASANSISLDETIPRPLVVGYLGFDLPIGIGGKLGPPIPTYALLTGQVDPSKLSSVPSGDLRRVYSTLAKATDDQQAQQLVRDLDAAGSKQMPSALPCNLYKLDQQGGPLSILAAASAPVPHPADKPFPRLVGYRGLLMSTLEDLRMALSDSSVRVEGLTFPRDAAGTAALKGQVDCSERSLTKINAGLSEQSTLLFSARDYANVLVFGR